MTIIQHGTITKGGIAFDKPLPLPEGSKVIVHVETIDIEASSATQDETNDLAAAFPFFGLWADRTDIPDSAEYVRQKRATWRERPYRQD